MVCAACFPPCTGIPRSRLSRPLHHTLHLSPTARAWAPHANHRRLTGPSGISWRTHFLVKETLHRHRAGVESQRASSFMKSVKASQIPGEAARARTMIPLFALPFTLVAVLASTTSGDQHFREIVKLCRPQPHRDWGRARAAGNRARDDK
jgi:hypothetical protein